MALGELGVQAEGERDEAVRVGPEGEEAAGAARGGGGDGGGLEEGDGVQGGVEGPVAREEVGRRAADDAASWERVRRWGAGGWRFVAYRL